MNKKLVRYILPILIACLLALGIMGLPHFTGIAAAGRDSVGISPAALSQPSAAPQLGASQALTETGIPFTIVDHDAFSGSGISLVSYGNHLVRDSAGNLYAAYTLYTQQSTHLYNYIRASTDNGATWSAPVRPDSFPDSIVSPNLQVDSLDRLHLGYIFNVSAYYTRSDDHGATWKPYTPLRDNWQGSYFPSVAIDNNDNLTAAYIEFGNNDSPPPWPNAIRQSTDGGDTWGVAVNPPAPNQNKSSGDNLVAGKNGWMFLTFYNYLSASNYSQYLQFFDGATWSTPTALSDPGFNAYFGDLAVDSTGIVHIVYGQIDPITGLRAAYYRTFDPSARSLSPARRLSADDENIYSVTLGVYQGDVVVTAYDHYSMSGIAITFGGVYVRSSTDDFASLLRISTHPNARNPNLRSSTFHFNQPDQQDILWVEPSDLGGEDLVYGTLSGHLASPGLDVNVFGPHVANPGQLAPYAITYRNGMTETAQSAVLVATLPGGVPFSSCTGGCLYRPDEHAAIWKLGDLAPGAQGRFILWLKLPWGMPASHIFVTTRLDSLTSDSNELDVNRYLNYNPPVLQNRYDLSSVQLEAVLADPVVQPLAQRLLQLGFLNTGAGQHTNTNDGHSIDQVVFIRPKPLEAALLSRSGGRAIVWRDAQDYIEVFNASGGMIIKAADGVPESYGSWVNSTPAPSFAGLSLPVYGPFLENQPKAPQVQYFNPADKGTCYRNCIAEVPYDVTKGLIKDTVLGPFNLVYGGLAGTYYAITGQWNEAGKTILDNAPGSKVTGAIISGSECDVKCESNPHEYDCGAESGAIGKMWCVGSTWSRHYCGGANTYQFAPIEAHCVNGCNSDKCATKECTKPTSLQSLAVVQPAAAPQVPNSVCGSAASCKQDDTEVVPAHDPNAITVNPAGDILPGQFLTYTIEFENTGAGTAYDVFILDTLDGNLNEASLSLSYGGLYDPATRQASWFIGEVAPGTGDSVTMTVQARTTLVSGDQIINQAKVNFPSAGEVTPTNLVASLVNTIVAEPQELNVVAGVPLALTLAGREQSGAVLTYTVETLPLYGKLEGTPPNLNYVTPLGFAGPDEFTFVAHSGAAHSTPARVVIQVTASPDDHTPPVVTSTTPNAGLGASTRSGSAAARFSKPLNPLTIAGTFTLVSPDGPLAGTLSYASADRALIFTPGAAFQPETTYTATLSASIADLAGNTLGDPYIWSFTTAPAIHLEVNYKGHDGKMEFPPIAVSKTETETLILANLGESDLALGEFTIEGPASADYTIPGGGACRNSLLSSGVSCYLPVVFTPHATGVRQATLVIQSNDPHTPQLSVPLVNTFFKVYLPDVKR